MSRWKYEKQLKDSQLWFGIGWVEKELGKCRRAGFRVFEFNWGFLV